jgi:hypothetical protein
MVTEQRAAGETKPKSRYILVEPISARQEYESKPHGKVPFVGGIISRKRFYRLAASLIVLVASFFIKKLFGYSLNIASMLLTAVGTGWFVSELINSFFAIFFNEP